MTAIHDIGPGCAVLDDQGYDWAWAFVRYREITGAPGYVVGTNQTVWSSRDPVAEWRSLAPKVAEWRRLKPLSKDGYLYFGFRGPHLKRRLRLSLHVLMLQAFIGPRPPGMVACHYDGVRPNCRLSNLRWDTMKANQADKIRHGTSNRGERSGSAKLNWAQVAEIRAAAKHETQASIARRYRISSGHICQILAGKKWQVPTEGEANGNHLETNQ